MGINFHSYIHYNMEVSYNESWLLIKVNTASNSWGENDITALGTAAASLSRSLTSLYLTHVKIRPVHEVKNRWLNMDFGLKCIMTGEIHVLFCVPRVFSAVLSVIMWLELFVVGQQGCVTLFTGILSCNLKTTSSNWKVFF